MTAKKTFALRFDGKAWRSRNGLGLREKGQAALGIVLGLTVILVTGAGLLATDSLQHDPLVQADIVQHYAYRATEAGVNTYLSQINGNSNLINCWTGSPVGGQCSAGFYDTWEQVDGTNTGGSTVPEWYLWGNPVFCFNPACTGTPGPTSILDHVQVPIYGAAGFPGHLVYENTLANFAPVNGFLTRVWWSNFEATDPFLDGDPPSACTWDWNNGYQGPPVTGSCQPVEFYTGDQLYGPIFSNDSIYVGGDPTLGPVTTHDPNCLFVADGAAPQPVPPYGSWCTAAPNNAVVQQSAADAAKSAKAQPFQSVPTTDSALATYAKLDGCLYQGPTVITFDNATGGPPGTGHMSVWSPDTTTEANSNICLGNDVNIPNGQNGNGVIYVQTAASGCVAGANPYDNWNGTANGPNAQLNYKGTYANYAGASASPDCEADAFVSDNPGPGGPSSGLPNNLVGQVVGQLTVASQNNIVITGDLQYPSTSTDCGTAFDSTHNNPCVYNPTGTSNNNDMLGLIAQNYVEVNHPVQPACTTNHGVTTCNGAGNLEAACTTAQMGIPSAALCDPGGSNGETIDAAILALNHSFLVNNWGSGTSLEPGPLTVYGSIAQDWRGAVGTAGSTGYVKDYDWDARAEFLSPPYYLAPGTPSWQLNSSATILDQGAPASPIGAAP